MSDCESPQRAFERAVKVAGRQVAFARLIGKTQSAVSKRLSSGQPCWPEDVLKVEEATGISRHDLRPDIYPRDDSPAVASADRVEGLRP